MDKYIDWWKKLNFYEKLMLIFTIIIMLGNISNVCLGILKWKI